MAGRTYLRWDKHQRVQHLLLIISVTTLIMTGMPLKYPEARLSRAAMVVVGGPETAGVVHRCAAVLLALVGVYHLLYLIRAYRCGNRSRAMLPHPQDGRDLVQMLRYYVGFTPNPPRFDRYTYTEKFEYWAMVWGSFIMLLTGLMLWFPVGTARVFSVVILHIAQVIHSYEALLAALSLIIWHFYHAHLNPDVFPMSKVWLTGRMTEKELQHHHPLEYERMLAQEQRIDDEESVAPVGAVGGVVDEPLLYPAVDSREEALPPDVITDGDPRRSTADEVERSEGPEHKRPTRPPGADADPGTGLL